MEKPAATYRIQLNREFDFKKLKNILPYLSQLGITHIYASPIFTAKRGSMHGYDVTDHDHIHEELGGSDAFDELSKEAAACGLGWIQDIVPNHISYSPQSRIISQIMEHGADSTYHSFPDVDWNHPSPKLRGKMLAPFLKNSYAECLQQGEIRLVYSDGFAIKYEDNEFPVKLSTYKDILPEAIWTATLAKQEPETLKQKLRKLYNSDETTRKATHQAVENINNNPKSLDKLLSAQMFALTDWRTALKHINYRRFFDVIDLVCLRTERKDVFDAIHRLLSKLLAEGKVTGLRIDHIDGLHNPEEYLERLRERAPDTYVIVEKILTNGEDLPDSWPVQGTTGYDFMNQVNKVLIDGEGEADIDAIYKDFTGKDEDFTEIVYKCKQVVVRTLFGGDIENLTRMLAQFLREKPCGKRCSPQRMRQAITELFCLFPVYRTYLNEKRAEDWNCNRFKEALSKAKKRNERLHCELAALNHLLKESGRSRDALRVIMRLQQFTGSVMAKGIEDTAFYVYNRLLSLNEVGGNPKQFSCSSTDFHKFNLRRQENWSFSMNSTSTHDVKRGEDVRARLNVLSEVPSEFRSLLKKWSELNLRRKRKIRGQLVPSRNEEYYIYQTLLGAFPFNETDLPPFRNRLKTHMVKALREAKINSTWLDPDFDYEEAVAAFAAELPDPDRENVFLREFLPFQKKIAFLGFLNSLAQTLLKITSPGVPDFYQGSELWDLSLVDPDNRGPVDFRKRMKLLEKIARLKTGSVHELLETYEDGRVKLYEIHKALQTRKENRELFQYGAYIPLQVKGTLRNHVVAFCRKKDTRFAITVVPRFLSKLTDTLEIPKDTLWKDTRIILPENAPRDWIDIFTQEKLSSHRTGGSVAFRIGDLFRSFPVALLTPNA